MVSERPSRAAALADGLDRLRELLGGGFEVAVTTRDAGPSATVTPGSTTGRIADASVEIRDVDSDTSVEVLVEAMSELSPAEVDRVLRPRVELLHRLSSRAVPMVLAPWLSPRTRDALNALTINYVDLTGNARLDIRRPRVLVRTQGAAKDPFPAPTATRSLAGPRAGRLVRWMVDRPPPYRVIDLAGRTQLSAGYVSRLLDVIEDLGLLQRHGRTVTGVDWVGLLRERAATVDLLRSNRAVTALAPRGPQSVLDRLSSNGAVNEAVTVTGAAAAAAIAPLMVGGQLMFYVPAEPGATDRLLGDAGLLPTDHGANVVLLVPFDPVAVERRRKVGGIWHVALSQLALDCLSGPDRLPAAGEAVLQHMIDTERRWRTVD